jgi:hypothetical protein
VTIADANSNAYTFSPKSPLTGTGFLAGGKVYNAYILVAPSNISATNTLAWTGSGGGQLTVAEFDVTGMSHAPVFDTDAVSATNATASGTSIATPTITPSNTNELLFAYTGNATAPVAPVLGATLGGWTGAGIDTPFADATEYILSASSAEPVAFTAGATSDPYVAIAMAIGFPSPTSVSWPWITGPVGP